MQNLTHEQVAARAQEIWEQAGRPEGQADEHWLRAERELAEHAAPAKKPAALSANSSAAAPAASRKPAKR